MNKDIGNKQESEDNKVFDYRTLRLLVGIIAFALPWVVTFVSSLELPSISYSYHTDARHWFVGLLFVVSAFLLAYNGHNTKQQRASKIASIAAFMVAVFPTSQNDEGTWVSGIHFGAALVLFGILTWFCFAFFRNGIKAQRKSIKENPRINIKLSGEIQTIKERVRSGIYIGCGIAMIMSMSAIAIAKILVRLNVVPNELIGDWSIVYWGEALALAAFGFAWLTAGKIRLLTDKKDALVLIDFQKWRKGKG